MITKAVVPVAGKGSRLHPLTSVVPKALFPLVDSAGRCRPVIHWICAEAKAAGVTELALVVSPAQEGLIEQYLNAAANAPPALPRVIELLVQTEPLGFGDALAHAERFVGKDNFLLMLGDHVYRSARSAPPCAAQVIDAFDKLESPVRSVAVRRFFKEPVRALQTGPVAVIGMQPAPARELERVGVARGVPVEKGIYRCADFVEKPTPAIARRRLTTPGLEKGHYLAHCGLYVFRPEIFACLSEIAADQSGEIALADAQSFLLARHPDDYFLCRIRGNAHDTGTPENYARTAAAFSRRT
jgi:UTP--glucose-1-phosphate uridylyltransferase